MCNNVNLYPEYQKLNYRFRLKELAKGQVKKRQFHKGFGPKGLTEGRFHRRRVPCPARLHRFHAQVLVVPLV